MVQDSESEALNQGILIAIGITIALLVLGFGAFLLLQRYRTNQRRTRYLRQVDVKEKSKIITITDPDSNECSEEVFDVPSRKGSQSLPSKGSTISDPKCVAPIQKKVSFAPNKVETVTFNNQNSSLGLNGSPIKNPKKNLQPLPSALKKPSEPLVKKTPQTMSLHELMAQAGTDKEKGCDEENSSDEEHSYTASIPRSETIREKGWARNSSKEKAPKEELTFSGPPIGSNGSDAESVRSRSSSIKSFNHGKEVEFVPGVIPEIQNELHSQVTKKVLTEVEKERIVIEEQQRVLEQQNLKKSTEDIAMNILELVRDETNTLNRSRLQEVRRNDLEIHQTLELSKVQTTADMSPDSQYSQALELSKQDTSYLSPNTQYARAIELSKQETGEGFDDLQRILDLSKQDVSGGTDAELEKTLELSKSMQSREDLELAEALGKSCTDTENDSELKKALRESISSKDLEEKVFHQVLEQSRTDQGGWYADSADYDLDDSVVMQQKDELGRIRKLSILSRQNSQFSQQSYQSQSQSSAHSKLSDKRTMNYLQDDEPSASSKNPSPTSKSWNAKRVDEHDSLEGPSNQENDASLSFGSTGGRRLSRHDSMLSYTSEKSSGSRDDGHRNEPQRRLSRHDSMLSYTSEKSYGSRDEPPETPGSTGYGTRPHPFSPETGKSVASDEGDEFKARGRYIHLESGKSSMSLEEMEEAVSSGSIRPYSYHLSSQESGKSSGSQGGVDEPASSTRRQESGKSSGSPGGSDEPASLTRH